MSVDVETRAWPAPAGRVRRRPDPVAAATGWLAQRHSLPAETALLVVLYAAYDLGRGAVVSGVGAAVAHAHDLYRLERHLHLAIERPVQHASMAVPGLTVTFGITYMALHLLLTGAVLLWLHRRHPEGYVLLRTALVVCSVAALVGFIVWPTAPPRLAGIGVAGTLSQAGVALNSPTLTVLFNPYAAFPSLHEAYAALTGWAIRRQARNRVLWLVGGVVMPIWVAVEVIATGNHFVIDVVAGILTAELGRVVAVRLHRRAAQRNPAKRSSSGTAAPLRSDARTNHSCPKNLP